VQMRRVVIRVAAQGAAAQPVLVVVAERPGCTRQRSACLAWNCTNRSHDS
jgi:hypothetical protein